MKLSWAKATRMVGPNGLEPRTWDLVYSLLACRNRNLLLWACVAPLDSIPWHAQLESELMQTEPLVVGRPHVSTYSWEFVVLAVHAWTSAYEMHGAHGYLSLHSLMSLTMYKLHPMQLQVAPFLSDFVADTTAGFTDRLHWSLKCWSEYINEEILSKELYSAGFRLFFEGYYLQTLLFFPRSSWLFCSVGMTPWKYYTSSLAWLVWQKSEKIRFITKTAVISFQSKERTEEGKLWTWTFAAYMLPKLEELVCSV